MNLKRISVKHWVLVGLLFITLIGIVCKFYIDYFQNLTVNQVLLLLFIISSGLCFVLSVFCMSGFIYYYFIEKKTKHPIVKRTAKFFLGLGNGIVLLSTIFYMSLLTDKLISSVVVRAYIYSNNAIFFINDRSINCFSQKEIFPDALTPLIFSEKLSRSDFFESGGFKVTYDNKGLLKIQFGTHYLEFTPHKSEFIEIDHKKIKLKENELIFFKTNSPITVKLE